MINYYILAIALVSTTLLIKIWLDNRDYKRTIHKFEDSLEYWGTKYQNERKKYLYAANQLKDMRTIESEYQKLHSDYTVLYYENEKRKNEIPFAEPIKQCERCGSDNMRETKCYWICNQCEKRHRKE